MTGQELVDAIQRHKGWQNRNVRLVIGDSDIGPGDKMLVRVDAEANDGDLILWPDGNSWL